MATLYLLIKLSFLGVLDAVLSNEFAQQKKTIIIFFFYLDVNLLTRIYKRKKMKD